MSILIKNWSTADWKELLKWAKIGANNAMIGEFTEVEELPPHGRLIDADVFEKSLSTLLQFPSNLVNGQWIVNTIREQPTIIPEEEDGCGRCDHCRIPQTETCRYGEEGET